MYQILSMGKRADADNIVNLHAHDHWELVYYLSGNGTVISGGSRISFHPHMLVCNPPRVVHNELSGDAYSNLFSHGRADPHISLRKIPPAVFLCK